MSKLFISRSGTYYKSLEEFFKAKIITGLTFEEFFYNTRPISKKKLSDLKRKYRLVYKSLSKEEKKEVLKKRKSRKLRSRF